jgi:hypothetical protein
VSAHGAEMHTQGADKAKNHREKRLKANKNDAMRAEIARSTQFFSSLLKD